MAQQQHPAPDCPYCEKPSVLTLDSSWICDGHNYGPAWVCEPCGAWVFCDRNSSRFIPLGRLANAELRKCKKAAQAAFNPLWQSMVRHDVKKKEARLHGYKWLAATMGIKLGACSLDLFDVAECRRVIELCEAQRATGLPPIKKKQTLPPQGSPAYYGA